MKTIRIRSVFSVAVLLVALLASVHVSAKDKACISFEEPVYDFVQISLKKGKVSHEFTFTNSGKSNLTITNARADCGCTRPEYSEAPVSPGKGGKVKVTFAPAAKGHFSKKVVVTTNGSPRRRGLSSKAR